MLKNFQQVFITAMTSYAILWSVIERQFHFFSFILVKLIFKFVPYLSYKDNSSNLSKKKKNNLKCGNLGFLKLISSKIKWF